MSLSSPRNGKVSLSDSLLLRGLGTLTGGAYWLKGGCGSSVASRDTQKATVEHSRACKAHWMCTASSEPSANHAAMKGRAVYLGFFKIFKFFIFLATPRGMWDLSSLTRDRTRVPCVGSMKS